MVMFTYNWWKVIAFNWKVLAIGIKGLTDEWLNVYSKQSENASAFIAVNEKLKLLMHYFSWM